MNTQGCSKRHMTRSYFRKISTNETKKAKSDSKSKIKVANSRGGISVFNDSDAADVETVAADAAIPVPATSLPEGVRNFDNENDPIQAYCYAADLHKYYFEREVRNFLRLCACFHPLHTSTLVPCILPIYVGEQIV